jgi:hypothetical protein
LGHGVWSHLAIDSRIPCQRRTNSWSGLRHSDGKEVQEAIEYVLNLIAENRLPDKMVIVHPFAENVLINKDSIHPTDNTEVVINFDGHGLDAITRTGYNEFVQKQPIQYGEKGLAVNDT